MTAAGGNIYAFSVSLPEGSDYAYYFEAYDSYHAVASGAPTGQITGPTVTGVVVIPSTYYIKGQIKDDSGNALAGVQVNISGDVSSQTTSSPTGNYEFLNSAMGPCR